ncbi:MAG: FtsQ-type POTRA domain-containing protein [bacterium]
MFVVNARLRDKKVKWAPQLGKVLLILLAIGVVLALCGFVVDRCTRAAFTENSDYAMTNLVVVCRENPALAGEVRFAESGLRGTNLFRIPIRAIRDRLARTPCIKAVTVTRCLPRRLEIVLSERLPVARLGNQRDATRRLVVDDEGVVFFKDRDLTVITGYREAAVMPGDKLGGSLKDALTLMAYCAVSPAGQRIKMAAIDLKREYLEVRLDDGVKVLLEWNRMVPDIKAQRRELEMRLTTLVTTMSKARLAGVTLQQVDLTGEDPNRCVTIPRWTGGED